MSSDIVERDIKPMMAQDIAKLKSAVERRWDEKPWYQGGEGLGSPGCMLRAQEVLSLIAAIEALQADLAKAIEAKTSPNEIAAAWAAWHSRHGGRLGPGPAFVEAINAAFAYRFQQKEREA